MPEYKRLVEVTVVADSVADSEAAIVDAMHLDRDDPLVARSGVVQVFRVLPLGSGAVTHPQPESLLMSSGRLYVVMSDGARVDMGASLHATEGPF